MLDSTIAQRPGQIYSVLRPTCWEPRPSAPAAKQRAIIPRPGYQGNPLSDPGKGHLTWLSERPSLRSAGATNPGYSLTLPGGRVERRPRRLLRHAQDASAHSSRANQVALGPWLNCCRACHRGTQSCACLPVSRTV